MPSSVTHTLTTNQTQIELRLYAEGASYWPQGSTLFITDPHFGKADAFRHVGIAIPTNILEHDLARLSRLINETHATQLIILGDFFHTRHSQSDSVLFSLEQWRNHHHNVNICIVQGNHDVHAGAPPAHLGINSVAAPWAVGPFICHHLPQPQPDTAGYILAGHLHPHIVLRDRDGSTLRLASFIFTPHQAILPAFGGFTGGSVYTPSTQDHVFAIAQGEIVQIPTTRPRTPTARR